MNAGGQSRVVQKSYLRHLLAASLAAALIFITLAHWRDDLGGLNIDSLYAGATTYATGSMIALFLATFYSEDFKMKFLRAHHHARTIYYIIFTDLSILVASGLLIVNPPVPHNRAFSLAALSLIIAYTAALTWLLLKLVNIVLSPRGA